MSNDKYYIAFPSIEQLRHIIHKDLIPEPPNKLDYIGTIKLHGTNLGISEISKETPLIVQSRNRVLSDKIDNVNSYKWVMERETTFRNMFHTIRTRCSLCDGVQITIYGEFAGSGIQGGVAISTISKFFSIFHVLVNGQFLSMDSHSDIHDNTNRIYHVAQYGVYHISIDKSNIDTIKDYIENLTKEIGDSCPAGKYLGKDGVGEGLVWICTNDTRQELWFKSKCEYFKLASTGKLNNMPTTKEEKDRAIFAEQFAKEYMTNSRIEQGISEVGKDIKQFIHWCIDDILKEEGGSLDEKQRKLCEKAITKVASNWYGKNIGF